MLHKKIIVHAVSDVVEVLWTGYAHVQTICCNCDIEIKNKAFSVYICLYIFRTRLRRVCILVHTCLRSNYNLFYFFRNPISNQIEVRKKESNHLQLSNMRKHLLAAVLQLLVISVCDFTDARQDKMCTIDDTSRAVGICGSQFASIISMLCGKEGYNKRALGIEGELDDDGEAKNKRVL